MERAVHHERAENVAKIQAMRSEAKQAKNELAEENRRISSLMEEIGELKLTTDIHTDRRYRAEEGQRRVE